MCFALPMLIVRTDAGTAHCIGGGREEDVSLALTGPVDEGAYVLVYLGSAVRILSEEEAGEITSAIEAVAAAAQGLPFEHLIADLADREPQLPEHLRSQTLEDKNENWETNHVAALD